MSLELIQIAIVIGVLALLLAMGTELIIALGVTSLVAFVFLVDTPIYQFAWAGWTSLNSFTLTAAPLFIFMGLMLAGSGVTEYLLNAVEKWIGGFPGGLAASSIGAQAVFGAMCGDTIPAAATFGTTVFPEMEKKGYDPRLALGSIAVGGLLSPLIPPSIIMILYASWQHLSVIRLFAAGLIPGILMAILFIITIIIWVKVNPKLAPRPEKYTWRERLITTRDLLPWVAIVALVLGVIFGGIMTPTEAAALGSFLSIIMALAYRRLSWALFKKTLLHTARISGVVMIILPLAKTLGYVFAVIGFTEMVTNFFMNLPFGVYGTLTTIFLFYLLLGMWFNAWSMLFLTMPLIMPVIIHLGIDPIWWGVAYVVIAEFSTVTPPVGVILFTLQAVVPQHPIGTIVRGALPFIFAVIITEVLLVAFPQIALWLPSVMFAR